MEHSSVLSNRFLYNPAAACHPCWGLILASDSFQISVGEIIVVLDNI